MTNATITPETFDYDLAGTDERFVDAAPGRARALDDALGLHPISIRLQKDLLDNLKALAQLNGIGYQPLIRQVLTRFVDCEMKNMLRHRVAEHAPADGENGEDIVEDDPNPRERKAA